MKLSLNKGSMNITTTNMWHYKQESRAVAGKARDAAVIFQDGGRLLSWVWLNRK